MKKKTPVYVTDIFGVDAKASLKLNKAFAPTVGGDKALDIKNFIYAVQASEEGEPILITVQFKLTNANAVYMTDEHTLVVQLQGNAPVKQVKYDSEDVRKMKIREAGMEIEEDSEGNEIIVTDPNRAQRRQAQRRTGKAKKSGRIA